ncbi:uncharacterized protein [Drosophila suzukii]|uniref:Uncharacterized protein n=1 Tax=Drosophila suzukii TaxID=28584 RepID=A0AB39Z9V6_DROSZ
MTVNILILGLSLLGITTAWPQDIGSGVMMAAGQVQQVFEMGSGLPVAQSAEIPGQGYEADSYIGEAIQMPMGRRR